MACFQYVVQILTFVLYSLKMTNGTDNVLIHKRKIFISSNERLNDFGFIGLAVLLVSLLACLIAYLASAAAIATTPGQNNPLDLPAIFTISTVVSGVVLFLENSQHKDSYSTEDRTFLIGCLVTALICSLALSMAYEITPAISICTFDTNIDNPDECTVSIVYNSLLTNFETIIHILVLWTITALATALQQLRVPQSTIRQDLIIKNFERVKLALVAISDRRTESFANGNILERLYAPVLPQETIGFEYIKLLLLNAGSKLKLYIPIVPLLAMEATPVFISKFLILYCYFSTAFPSSDFQAHKPFTIPIVLISSILVVVGMNQYIFGKISSKNTPSHRQFLIYGLLFIFTGLLVDFIPLLTFQKLPLSENLLILILLPVISIIFTGIHYHCYKKEVSPIDGTQDHGGISFSENIYSPSDLSIHLRKNSLPNNEYPPTDFSKDYAPYIHKQKTVFSAICDLDSRFSANPPAFKLQSEFTKKEEDHPCRISMKILKYGKYLFRPQSTLLRFHFSKKLFNDINELARAIETAYELRSNQIDYRQAVAGQKVRLEFL